jgi:hypothetical protein
MELLFFCLVSQCHSWDLNLRLVFTTCQKLHLTTKPYRTFIANCLKHMVRNGYNKMQTYRVFLDEGGHPER